MRILGVVLHLNECLLLFLAAWQQGCARKAGRDPQCLSTAGEAMLTHIGRQLAQLEPQRAQQLVSECSHNRQSGKIVLLHFMSL